MMAAVGLPMLLQDNIQSPTFLYSFFFSLLLNLYMISAKIRRPFFFRLVTVKSPLQPAELA
jgi:hypothetical protein